MASNLDWHTFGQEGHVAEFHSDDLNAHYDALHLVDYGDQEVATIEIDYPINNEGFPVSGDALTLARDRAEV